MGHGNKSTWIRYPGKYCMRIILIKHHFNETEGYRKTSPPAQDGTRRDRLRTSLINQRTPQWSAEDFIHQEAMRRHRFPSPHRTVVGLLPDPRAVLPFARHMACKGMQLERWWWWLSGSLVFDLVDGVMQQLWGIDFQFHFHFKFVCFVVYKIPNNNRNSPYHPG